MGIAPQRTSTWLVSPLVGTRAAQVTGVVHEVATAFSSLPVTVVAGEVTVTSTAGALGLSLDEGGTVETVMDHGQGGFPVARFFRWVWSYVSDSDVEPEVVVDDTVAEAEVERLLAGKTGGPIEPSFVLQEGRLVAIAGRPGLGIETEDVVAGLHTVRYSRSPVRVEVASHTVQPRYSVEDARGARRRGERPHG